MNFTPVPGPDPNLQDLVEIFSRRCVDEKRQDRVEKVAELGIRAPVSRVVESPEKSQTLTRPDEQHGQVEIHGLLHGRHCGGQEIDVFPHTRDSDQDKHRSDKD